MITLRIAGAREPIGTISEQELAQMVEALEEEHDIDQDYYVDADTLAYLEESGVSANVVGILKAALGEQDGIDIEWSESTG